LPPYNALDTCVCMGASVSMAKGGAEAGIFPSVGMIGDSTFAHSGITPLVDAAAADTNMTLIIVDNASVAMTGGQPSFVMTPLPKNLEENKGILNEEIEHQGLSVIVASRECVQQVLKRKKKGAK